MHRSRDSRKAWCTACTSAGYASRKSRRAAPHTANTNGSPVHCFHSYARSLDQQAQRGASYSVARSATSPITPRRPPPASSDPVRRRGEELGRTPYFSSSSNRASRTRCGLCEPSATRAPSSWSIGTWLTSITDITGPSAATAMSGSTTRSSAWRRYSTTLIGAMSRSPRTRASLRLSGVLGQVQIHQRSRAGQAPVMGRQLRYWIWLPGSPAPACGALSTVSIPEGYARVCGSPVPTRPSCGSPVRPGTVSPNRYNTAHGAVAAVYG